MNNIKLDFYQIIGVIAPGIIISLGLLYLFPKLFTFFINNGFSIGSLGVVLIISYIMGNLIQAIGNIVENVWWNIFDGKPTHWVIQNKKDLLTKPQAKKLLKNINNKIDYENCYTNLGEFDENEWKYIVNQIRTIVNENSYNRRLFIFNSIYGLNRGIFSSLLTLSVLFLIIHNFVLEVIIALILFSILALYRMHRFAKYYAKELFNQFINIK